jgi:uncharacterized RDD family membrane protein YckC
MATHPPDKRPDGVYFSPGDYAGFVRRVAAGVVDVVALWVIWLALAFAWWLTEPELSLEGAFVLACYLYLAPLKASRARTLGYRLAGLRVVDLYGRRPSLARMTLRCLPLMVGAGFWLTDLLWMFGERERRKLTDLLAGTYVVRAGVEAAGNGPVVAAYYDAFGYFLVFGEVRRAAGAERPRLA